MKTHYAVSNKTRCGKRAHESTSTNDLSRVDCGNCRKNSFMPVRKMSHKEELQKLKRDLTVLFRALKLGKDLEKEVQFLKEKYLA